MSHLPAPIAASAGLRDGARICLHTVGPEDRACLADGFARLSPASRQSRFLRPISRLDGPTLDYLTQIDGSRHLAVAASTDDEPVARAVSRGGRGASAASPAGSRRTRFDPAGSGFVARLRNRIAKQVSIGAPIERPLHIPFDCWFASSHVAPTGYHSFRPRNSRPARMPTRSIA